MNNMGKNNDNLMQECCVLDLLCLADLAKWEEVTVNKPVNVKPHSA